jgi:hypothetical protein
MFAIPMLVNFLEVSDLKLNMYQKKMEEPLDFSFGKYRGRPIFFLQTYLTTAYF